MTPRLSDLWSWRGELKRGPFFFWGLILCVIKYNLDRALMYRWTGRRWSLLDYQKFGEYLWPRWPTAEGAGEYFAILAVALPFMTVGVLLTLKRLRSIGLSPWLVLIFFVPVVKLFFFLLLSVLPSRERRSLELRRGGGMKQFVGMVIPRTKTGSAAAGIIFATLSSALCVWLGTTVFRSYGWALFVGLPFVLGFLSVLVFGYHEERSRGECLWVSTLATMAAGVALLLVALEGLICLIMAVPLALPMALLGGFVAYHVQAAEWWQGQTTEMFCIAALAPVLMFVEQQHPAPLPLLRVTTSVVVDAPPERVWHNVVSFSELPPPEEWIFRMGIAYPMRARIHGTGVGAERHCEFSTGPFVEPIEVWDEPRLLKFAVTKNPAPMQEWTPYHDVHPPHLDNFLESRAGQFRLVRLPDGRTQLEGTTWYHHHLWPATYWRWWSDYIIHTIHRRVLRHVKQLSEAA